MRPSVSRRRCAGRRGARDRDVLHLEHGLSGLALIAVLLERAVGVRLVAASARERRVREADRAGRELKSRLNQVLARNQRLCQRCQPCDCVRLTAWTSSPEAMSLSIASCSPGSKPASAAGLSGWTSATTTPITPRPFRFRGNSSISRPSQPRCGDVEECLELERRVRHDVGRERRLAGAAGAAGRFATTCPSASRTYASRGPGLANSGCSK